MSPRRGSVSCFSRLTVGLHPRLSNVTPLGFVHRCLRVWQWGSHPRLSHVTPSGFASEATSGTARDNNARREGQACLRLTKSSFNLVRGHQAAAAADVVVDVKTVGGHDFGPGGNEVT